MEYECKIMPATRIYADFNKVIKPLCSTCVNHGCENPIVEHKISVFGVIQTTRLYKTGTHMFQVTECDGYRGELDEDEEII